MTFRQAHMPAASIDDADDFFRITTRTDTSDLVQSIQSVKGVINPPLLRSSASGHHVVFGFRRIAACRVLGYRTISCRITDQPFLDCAKLAVVDNMSQRDLNTVELSNAIGLLARCSSGTAQLQNALLDLGLPAKSSFIAKMMQIQEMPASLKSGIANNSIALPVARKLTELPVDDALVLADLFRNLTVSLNKQLEITALTDEIAHREDISISDLFNEPELSQILENENAEKSRAAGRLRTYLKKRRFPKLVGVEQNFENIKKSLKLPPNVQFQAPPYFEGDTYTIAIKFSSMEELEQCRKIFDRLISHPELKTSLD
ncbi:MAG: ParB N-terminal domain-containing protein [Desulfobacterales bacterium]